MNFARALTFVAAAWLALVAVAVGQAVSPLALLPAPDVVLLVVLYVGLTTQPAPGVVGVCALGLTLGWLADLSTGAPKGLHMAAYALAGLAAHGASARILVRGRLLTALVAALFSLGAGLFVVALRTSLEPRLGWGALKQVPLAAAMTALIAPLGFRLLKRLDRRFTRDPRLLGGAANAGKLR